jgi:enoyl-[acyl-carrier-protein] reductase (NADH)
MSSQPQGLFAGKKGVITGVANGDSIAWAIAQFILEQGACAALPTCPTGPTTSGSGTSAGSAW